MPGLSAPKIARKSASARPGGPYTKGPSAKSKTHSGVCSAAASAWVLGRKSGSVPPGVYAVLAKCRQLAKGGSHAAAEGLKEGVKPPAVERARAVIQKARGGRTPARDDPAATAPPKPGPSPAGRPSSRDAIDRLHEAIKRSRAHREALKARGVKGARYDRALDREISLVNRADDLRDRRAVELKALRRVRDARAKATPIRATDRGHFPVAGEAGVPARIERPPAARPTPAQLRDRDFRGKMSKAAAMRAHAAKKAAEAEARRAPTKPVADPSKPAPSGAEGRGTDARRRIAERLKAARAKAGAKAAYAPGGAPSSLKKEGSPGDLPGPGHPPSAGGGAYRAHEHSVGNRVRVRAEGHVGDAYHAAFDAIHAVHHGRGLPEIEAHAHPGLKTTLGEYVHDRHRAHRINLNPEGRHPAFTAVHEAGHYLDHQGLGTQGYGFASEEGAAEGVMRAISATKTHKNLLRETKNSKDRKVRELADPKEVFARAYSQYVAHRSRHPELLAGLANDRRDAFPGSKGFSKHWPDAEFEPVAAEFDKLFRARGLLHERG